MKTKLAAWCTAAILCLGVAAFPTLMVTGCVSGHTQQQLSLKSLETTMDAVRAARRAYAKVYAAGRIDPITHMEAVDADRKFRESFNRALDAAELNWDNVTPSNVALAAQAFIDIARKATE